MPLARSVALALLPTDSTSREPIIWHYTILYFGVRNFPIFLIWVRVEVAVRVRKFVAFDCSIARVFNHEIAMAGLSYPSWCCGRSKSFSVFQGEKFMEPENSNCSSSSSRLIASSKFRVCIEARSYGTGHRGSTCTSRTSGERPGFFLDSVWHFLF